MILLILYELWNTTMWDVLQCVSQCVEYRAITVRIKLITHYRKVIYPWRMCNNYNLTCGARSTSSYCRIDALFQLFVCVCQIPTMHWTQLEHHCFFVGFFPKKNIILGVFGTKRRIFYGVFRSFFGGFAFFWDFEFFFGFFWGFRREAPKNAKNNVFKGFLKVFGVFFGVIFLGFAIFCCFFLSFFGFQYFNFNTYQQFSLYYLLLMTIAQ